MMGLVCPKSGQVIATHLRVHHPDEYFSHGQPYAWAAEALEAQNAWLALVAWRIAWNPAAGPAGARKPRRKRG